MSLVARLPFVPDFGWSGYGAAGSLSGDRAASMAFLVTCYYPLQGWRGRVDGRVVFSVSEALTDRPVTVGCGRCMGCRIERSRQWGIRMSHEAQLHDENCFLTLTYSDENLPENGSLRKSDFQKFMKRLRTRVSPRRFKFFHCGEYGDDLSRPHYHAVLFGFDFSDRVYFSTVNGNRYYISDMLADLWPFGHHLIGGVTFGSCQYVAGYVTKKINGDRAAEHYGARAPEYSTQSNGIGKEWFLKFHKDVFNNSLSSDVVVTAEGQEMKPPRYYMELYKDLDLVAAKKVRGERIVAAKARGSENGSTRLRVREKVAVSRAELYSKRSYENAAKDVLNLRPKG